MASGCGSGLGWRRGVRLARGRARDRTPSGPDACAAREKLLKRRAGTADT